MNLANKITVARVFAIPFFIFFLMTDFVPGSKWISLAIFIIASLSDFVDGKIARKYNMVSNFGKFMDPLADKLLVCSALVCLLTLYYEQNSLFVYLVLLIISRDFVIQGFRLVASDQGVVLAAGILGKIKTTLQMIMIGFLIGYLELPDIEAIHVISVVLEYMVAFFTVYSLFDYLYKNRDIFKDMSKGKLGGKRKDKSANSGEDKE